MLPFDTTLLLRVHAEHHWLQSELIPVLEQIESSTVMQAGELQAALAYLEVTWSEAQRRARDTDCAHDRLERDAESRALESEAVVYYRWVRTLTNGLGARVDALVGAPIADATRRQSSAA